MFAEHAVAWILTYLLHSTLLLALAWLISKPLSRWSVAAEEAVWKVALVGAILTASLQVATGWEPVAGRWRLAPIGVAAASSAAGSVAPAETAGVVSSPDSALAMEGPGDLGMPRAKGEPGVSAAPRFAARRVLPAIGLGAWALVAIVLFVGSATSYLRLRRRLRARPRVIGGTLLAQFRRLTLEAGWGEEVGLTCSSRIPVPLALGLRRAEICVPPRALAGLSDEQQEGMLAHELAHLVRRDPGWLVLSQAISCLLFFQPLNWVARRRLREISEMLSDEWAVSRTGRPLSLAGCLAEVAGWSVAGRPLPVPGMADRPSNLGRRIRRLLDETRSPEHPARRFWLAAAMGVLVLAVAAAAPAISAAREEAKAKVAKPAQAAGTNAAPSAKTAAPPKPESWQEVEDDPDVEVDVDDVDGDAGDVDVDVDVDVDSEVEIDIDPDLDLDIDLEDSIGPAVEQATASLDEALDSLDVGLEGLAGDGDHAMSPEERKKIEGEIERVNRQIEQTLKPRMEQLAREMSEKASRLQEQSVEMQRLQAAMQKLGERMRPSAEDMARLHAQIEAQVEKLRADGEMSRQEREQLAREAREMARDLARQMRPTEEQRRQMEQLRRDMQKQSAELGAKLRADHSQEIEQAQREMREQIQQQMRAIHEELRRTLEQHRLREREERRERQILKEREKEIEKEREKSEAKPPKVSLWLDPLPEVKVWTSFAVQTSTCSQ